MPRLHLQGVVLPEGEHRDLWVVDGVLRTEPVGNAETVAENAFVMPGLVDAHCHVGLESRGAVTDAEAEQHALADRNAGALLLRDAGSPADTRWMDQRADLPKIIRPAGTSPVPSAICATTARRSSPTSWSPRWSARPPAAMAGSSWWGTGSTATSVTWPPLAGRGGRTGDRAGPSARLPGTAHVFGEQALVELVEAGIDGIEHGTGLSDAVTVLMAERQVALVPTMVQLENFESCAAAGEARFPAYARHIRSLYATRLERFAKAREAGVPIYAGTDAGGFLPHGLVGQEMAALAAFSSPAYALGAGFVAGSGLARPPRTHSPRAFRPTWSSSTPTHDATSPC